MRCDDLKLLQCPFCEGGFEVEVISKYADGNIRWGEVCCDCGKFPIAEGILVLKNGLDDAVKAVENGDYTKALSLIVDMRKRSYHCWLLATIWLRVNRSADKKTFRQCLRIMEKMTLFGDERSWFRYLANREERKTFKVLKRLAGYVGQEGCLIDAAGGSGHFVSYLRSNKGQKIKIIFIENVFWLTYLGRRCGLIDDNCVVVVSDLEGVWPVVDRVGDWVCANDCLQYIGHQKLFLGEMDRVAKQGGQMLLGHVHNYGADNVAQGKGVKIDLLKKWLGGCEVNIIKSNKVSDINVKSFSVVATKR